MVVRLTLKNNHKNLNPLKCRNHTMRKRKKNTLNNSHLHAKVMKNAPTLFKGSGAVVIVDNKCGNIYVHFNDDGSHLSIHYLHNNRKTNTCECWNKVNSSNIHYKIDKTMTSKSIYIPIYQNSAGKFTYNSNRIIEAKHQKKLDWCIKKLNIIGK